MDPGTPRPLLLGLLGPRNATALPPITILAARAGWDSLWLEAGDQGPSDAAAGALSTGRIVGLADLTDPPNAHLWVRATGQPLPAMREIAALRAATPDSFTVSADAIDIDAARQIQAAGALPVFGPASVQVLVDLLRGFAGAAAVCLPASPGRTEAEAHARLAGDPLLEAEARLAPGLVGTLERCQQAVAALRHAGMTELRLRLPSAPDLPDVIAQISTLRGGALAGLQPGVPRSPDPAAPASWGGRP